MIDRVLFGIGDRVLNIVITQVEVAPQVQSQYVAGGCCNLGDPLLVQLRVEAVLGVRVRRSHQIGGAMFSRHANHGDGIFDGTRAIVQTIQHVAVNIDQT